MSSPSMTMPRLCPSFFSSFRWILSARSDDAELAVALGAAVDADTDAAGEVAAVGAVAAVDAVGLAMGVSVGACGLALEQLPTMIINSAATPREPSLRVVVASPVRV